MAGLALWEPTQGLGLLCPPNPHSHFDLRAPAPLFVSPFYTHLRHLSSANTPP
ncbi:hypothetical protein I79_014832 [Cricetulus griseus]|uniref:Uncharacterized protein n=1 Tax=Cricetulus griseus TaxID=10029 RepID=G3HV55_CRIGR|nr:hypothetical protein I79_014832 [Cricetulus griseus]